MLHFDVHGLTEPEAPTIILSSGLGGSAAYWTPQMEALKRYRTCGQQKVVVEHVTVQAGGQAIVGNVSHPGGGGRGNGESAP